MDNVHVNRRSFLRKSGALTALLGSATLIPTIAKSCKNPLNDGLHIVGPKEGYSPQLGTLVSMMNWMRTTVLQSVQGLTMEQLDFLMDDEANTIGAMLLHLAATERYYAIHTFEDKEWGDWSDQDKERWDVPMGLGDAGREKIKGHELDFYLSALEEVREATLAEFRKRDDEWLMKIDPHFFGNEPTNNYCKWFHVCEHESNHNGQIKFIKGRIPK